MGAQQTLLLPDVVLEQHHLSYLNKQIALSSWLSSPRILIIEILMHQVQALGIFNLIDCLRDREVHARETGT